MHAKPMSQPWKIQMELNPHNWNKGTLIDMRRYRTSLGVETYRATILGDEDDPKRGYVAPFIEFDNSVDAQNWISAWYVPDQQRFG
jgi:hypothetical protein